MFEWLHNGNRGSFSNIHTFLRMYPDYILDNDMMGSRYNVFSKYGDKKFGQLIFKE